MGRKTWDSLPKKPLPGRVNVVVSRSSPPSLTLPRMAGSGPALEGGGGSVHSGAHSPEPSPQGGEEVIWVKSLDEALLAPSPQPSSPEGGEGVEIELCIIGGAQIYAEALPRADRIYLTEVHAFPEGNVFMPAFDRALFTETFREDHVAEGETPAFSFVILDKRG
jgi:dihydrofolate reductase